MMCGLLHRLNHATVLNCFYCLIIIFGQFGERLCWAQTETSTTVHTEQWLPSSGCSAVMLNSILTLRSFTASVSASPAGNSVGWISSVYQPEKHPGFISRVWSISVGLPSLCAVTEGWFPHAETFFIKTSALLHMKTFQKDNLKIQS